SIIHLFPPWTVHLIEAATRFARVEANMSRRRQRLVALISLVAFLLALSPLESAAPCCRPREESSAKRDTGGCAPCCPCCEGKPATTTCSCAPASPVRTALRAAA